MMYERPYNYYKDWMQAWFDAEHYVCGELSAKW